MDDILRLPVKRGEVKQSSSCEKLAIRASGCVMRLGIDEAESAELAVRPDGFVQRRYSSEESSEG